MYSSSKGLRLDICKKCELRFINKEEGIRIINRKNELQEKIKADNDHYGNMLTNATAKTEKAFEQSGEISRFEIVNKILKKLFNW